ncbi:MAG: hypothetical protein ACI9WU_005184 [Myxococcota bacterium]|jgi:hypothetical protein
MSISVAGCMSEAPEGLKPTPAGTGPVVEYDPLDLPDPKVPWPNDLGTRFDATSPTGRRLNTSTEVPLEVERHLREQLNRLDGFSTIGQISVSFDTPLDLTSVSRDTVLLIDVTPGSPSFGHRVPMDLDGGAFPVAFRPRPVFAFDPNGLLGDLIFAETNTVDNETVTTWEVESNTLLLRPLFTLRPKTTYAVVLTDGVTGLDGQPVRSPFETVNHTAQTKALTPLQDLLTEDDGAIAFAWSFTTRSLTDDVLAIRDGLDGQGTLGWLKAAYPGKFLSFVNTDVEDDGHGSLYTLQPDAMLTVLGPLALAFNGLDKLDFGGVSRPTSEERTTPSGYAATM